jgi:hypothetical protein
MPAGLQVWNQQGDMIVDTNWPNMGLRTKISADGSGAFSLYAVNPVVFHTGDAHLFGVSRIGNNWTFRYGQLSPGVVFYVFDDMHSLPRTSSGIGFESYRDDGSLLFSTNYPPLRIVHFSQLPGSANLGGELHAYAGGGGTPGGHIGGSAYGPQWIYEGLPWGPTYAGMLSTYRYGRISSTTEYSYGDSMYETLGVRGNGFVIHGDDTGLGNELFGGILGSQYDPGYNPYVMLIDVTNY